MYRDEDDPDEGLISCLPFKVVLIDANEGRSLILGLKNSNPDVGQWERVEIEGEAEDVVKLLREAAKLLRG